MPRRRRMVWRVTRPLSWGSRYTYPTVEERALSAGQDLSGLHVPSRLKAWRIPASVTAQARPWRAEVGAVVL